MDVDPWITVLLHLFYVLPDPSYHATVTILRTLAGTFPGYTNNPPPLAMTNREYPMLSKTISDRQAFGDKTNLWERIEWENIQT